MANKKLTIKDIAKLAGVSTSTVSRVLDDNQRISDKTKAHVLEIINQNGYIPRAAASNLARNKTNAIGIVMPHDDLDIYSSSFFQEALKGISSVSSEQGYDILISSGNPTEVDTIRRLINSSRIDGIILLRSVVNDRNIKHLHNEGFPFVLIGTCLEYEDIYSVDNDNYSASFDLTSHLYECGKRRIAYIGGNDNSVFILRRLKGYRECLAQHSISVDSKLVKVGRVTETYGYDSMKELLKMSSRPDAVIVMDSSACVGVMRAIDEQNLKIPDQIAIACFSESTFTKYSKPAITTISLDFYDLGVRAATNLLLLLNGNKIKQGCSFIKHTLTIRESTVKPD